MRAAIVGAGAVVAGAANAAAASAEDVGFKAVVA